MMSVFSNSYDAAAEEADGYIAAVLALVGDRDPIGILGELPAALAEILADGDAAYLRRPERRVSGR